MIIFSNNLKNCNIPGPLRAYSVIFKLKMYINKLENAKEKVANEGVHKRLASSTGVLPGELPEKKSLIEVDKQDRIKKKKVAMLISYLGQGYLGLQRNPGTKTIEEDLMLAMLKAKLINEDIFNQPQVIQFQRAARTDKGVSALRQVLSFKFPENGSVDSINIYLPDQIRAIAVKRVTKGFNCKTNCDARTYSYTCPTFALAPQGPTTEDYRITPQVHERVSLALKIYEGTHNFHNFTSKRVPTDPSVQRYIMSFTCGDPFIVDDMEFVIMKVKGQSFMLHQIRKMVGLVIAIVKGMTTEDTISRAWERDKLDLPIAPGLGLLLEEVHYDRYNQRYGSDGMHDTLEWKQWESQIEDFRLKYILPTIIQIEKSEKSMLLWLDTLSNHSFDVRLEHLHSELDMALEKNKKLLSPPSNLDALIAATHVVETAS